VVEPFWKNLHKTFHGEKDRRKHQAKATLWSLTVAQEAHKQATVNAKGKN